jgi:hypothetical protein
LIDQKKSIINSDARMNGKRLKISLMYLQTKKLAAELLGLSKGKYEALL